MLNARTENQEIDKTNHINVELSDKNDCPAVLNQIWVRQILNKQDASDRAYAKKHSLEIAFTPKLLSARIADRSNNFNRVA